VFLSWQPNKLNFFSVEGWRWTGTIFKHSRSKQNDLVLLWRMGITPFNFCAAVQRWGALCRTKRVTQHVGNPHWPLRRSRRLHLLYLCGWTALFQMLQTQLKTSNKNISNEPTTRCNWAIFIPNVQSPTGCSTPRTARLTAIAHLMSNSTSLPQVSSPEYKRSRSIWKEGIYLQSSVDNLKAMLSSTEDLQQLSQLISDKKRGTNAGSSTLNLWHNDPSMAKQTPHGVTALWKETQLLQANVGG